MKMMVPKVEMLAASIDENDESEFRFLVNNTSFKYVTIEHGLYTVDDLGFAPNLLPQLPAFPPGDWNTAHISRDPRTNLPFFSSTNIESLPSIQEIWHDTFISCTDLDMLTSLKSNVWQVKAPQLSPTTSIVAKFARFPWETPYFASETAAYAWLKDTGVGPRFLGHLTEGKNGRVIGFLLEFIPLARFAGPDDLKACQKALGKLHALGILHGDANRYNFLVHGEGEEKSVTMIDFERAERVNNLDALRAEFESLSEKLADESGLGGVEVVENGEIDSL